MREDEIRRLEEKLDYLLEWLSRLKSAEEITSEVQKQIEQTQWEIDALKASPVEADEIAAPVMLADIERDLTELKISLPMMPSYNPSMVTVSGSSAIAGASYIFQFVSRVGDINTPAAKEYSQEYTQRYVELEVSQRRASEIRNLLIKLGNENTIERFDTAQENLLRYKAKTIAKEATANSIRNLLDGIKGDLFEMARKNPKENMNWEIMCDHLAKRDTENEIDLLLNSKKVRSSLVSRLSDVLKDRPSTSLTNLEYIWVEVLDHISIVLNLINI